MDEKHGNLYHWNGLMETSPNWQLPILWSGVSPSSAVWGTYSKMDRWMSLQRGFPILQKMKDFYAISRGTEEGGCCPNPPTEEQKRTIKKKLIEKLTALV